MSSNLNVPWRLTAFVVVMLPVVCTLGIWQLNRAAEKQLLEEAFLEAQGMQPTSLRAAGDFARVYLTGEFSSEQFFVDNQVMGGRVGYWVLQVFDEAAGGRVIVNRGWVEAPADRKLGLPPTDTPVGTLTTVGVVWPELGMPPLFAEDPWPESYPVRVQRRDLQRMAEATGARAVEVRLEAGQAGVLAPAPINVRFGRETHLAYAAQWFGLGLVLAVGWTWMFLRRKDRAPDREA